MGWDWKVLKRLLAITRSPYRRVHGSWLKLPVRYQGGVVVAIPAVCLLITLGSWVWSREALLAIRRSIEQAQYNLVLSNQILIQNLNAETGARGYAITSDPIFLAPYLRAKAALKSELQKLEQIKPRDRQVQVQKLQQLTQQYTDRLQQLIDAGSERSRTGNAPPLNQLMVTNKQAMDALRAEIETFQQQEQQWLMSYLQQRDQVQDATAAALWFTGIISALGSWAAIYLFTQVDRDLRDREQRLSESRSLLQAIVTSVVDGVIILDEQGKIESLNPTASTIFGYQPADVIGQNLHQLLAEPDPKETKAELETALQSGSTWQTRGLRSDRSTFPIAISISEVHLDDQRLIAIIRDMTEVQDTQEKLQLRADELAQMSERLAKTNTALEDRNQELEQFAYVASHDLKAPLRAIANLSEWIEEDLDGQLPEENQTQMRLLRGRVHRMEALINALLEYSRVGRIRAPIERVSVATLINDIIDTLAPPATFTIETTPDLPTFYTKVPLLRQVFTNLISNAIKHHHRTDGHIQISAQDQGEFYRFSVVDDGPGIHSSYHDRIFIIFQTLHARDVKESTGIGLAIVKKIVETEGGMICVESQEGQGAAFYFTWRKDLRER